MASPNDMSAVSSNTATQGSIFRAKRFPGLASSGYRALLQAYTNYFGKHTGNAFKPKQLTPAELHELYDGTTVPQHRYLAPSLTAAVNSPSIAMDPAKWFAGIADVNPSSVAGAWLNTNGSTEYEQLKFIGLEPNTSQLIGILTVKKRSGYCGGPSTAGSREFVAFWVDSGLGFEYEGTASVVVHDYSSLPATGRVYHVFLPVNLHSHAQPGSEGAKTVKVRAVLSWNIPPSTTNPSAPVVWGNSLDGQILISSGANVNRGARSNLYFASTLLPADEKIAVLTGFPQKQTGPAFRSGFRLQPLQNGVASK